jgi:hypothetical protein
MPYERKFEKVDLSSTEMPLVHLDKDTAWETAINHVTMGVATTPILVHNPSYNDDGIALPTYDDDRLQHGSYITESGRDGQFYMVMVDRDRTGEFRAVAACSDYYAAVEPHKIYESLKVMLEDSKHQPTYVYNAYNGGSQLLRVRVDDLQSVDLEGVDGIHMEIQLRTSLDKSTNHVLSVMPVTNNGTPILFSDTGGGGFTFKVRHTSGSRAEIVNFNAAVATIAAAWNKKIVPYVRFLSDGDLSEMDVRALLTNVVEDAGLPKDLGEEIMTAYKARPVKNAFTAVETLGEVIVSRDVTPMAHQRTNEKVAKAVTHRVKQLFEKHGSTSPASRRAFAVV